MSFAIRVIPEPSDHYHRARAWLRTSPVEWWGDLDQAAHAVGASLAVDELRDMAREEVSAGSAYAEPLVAMLRHANSVLAERACSAMHNELQFIVTELRSTLLADDKWEFRCLCDYIFSLGREGSPAQTVWCSHSTPSHCRAGECDGGQSARHSALLFPYVEVEELL